MSAQSGGSEGEICSDTVLAEDTHIAFRARCASGSRSAKCTWPVERYCSPGSHHRTRFPKDRAAPNCAWERTLPSHLSLYSGGAESLVTNFSLLRCSPWVPLLLSMMRTLCPPAMRAGGSSCLQADLWSTRFLFAHSVCFKGQTFRESAAGYSMVFWLLSYLSEIPCMWQQLEVMTDIAQATGQVFQYLGKWTLCSSFVRRQGHPKEHIWLLSSGFEPTGS